MIKKCKKKGLSVSRLADTQACVLFRGNTHGFGEGFEEIAVVRETAAFEGFHDIAVFVQNRLGDTDAAGGDVFINGGACGGFENPADIGFA